MTTQFSVAVQSWRQRLTIDRYTLFTTAVVSGVLLSAPVISYLYVRRRLDPLLVIAAIVGVIVVLKMFRMSKVTERDNKGIVLLIIAAGMLSFISLPTGRDSRIPISMLVSLALVGPWLFSMLFGASRLRPSPINRPLFAFVGVSIVAYVWALIFRDPNLYIWSSFPSVQVASLTVNILLPLTLLFVANRVTEVKWLKYLTAVLIVFAVVTPLLYFANNRVFDFFFYRGTRGLFSMWAAVLAYALALFLKGLRPWQRTLLLVVVGVLLFRYFVVGRSWVSGWLPMGVALLMLTWMRSRRLFAVLAVAGLIYIALNFNYYYENIVVAEEEGGSGSGRVELWLTNLNHVVNHPLFGMGPAGYAIYNMTYHRQDARSTHNNYFDILAQTGVIGMTVFLWLMARLAHVGRRSLRRRKGRGDFEEAFAAATLSGLAGTLVGMMLGDWMLPFAYNETIAGFDNAVLTWVMLGGMVALDGMMPSPLPEIDARQEAAHV
jgi:O-antigen ligase